MHNTWDYTFRYSLALQLVLQWLQVDHHYQVCYSYSPWLVLPVVIVLEGHWSTKVIRGTHKHHVGGKEHRNLHGSYRTCLVQSHPERDLIGNGTAHCSTIIREIFVLTNFRKEKFSYWNTLILAAFRHLYSPWLLIRWLWRSPISSFTFLYMCFVKCNNIPCTSIHIADHVTYIQSRTVCKSSQVIEL